MSEENRIIAALSYFIPIVGGIVVYLIREDKFERFHAIQSILFWVGAFIVSVGINIAAMFMAFIPAVGSIFAMIIGAIGLLFALAVFALWLVLMWKAYEYERYKLPVLGEYAEKYSFSA